MHAVRSYLLIWLLTAGLTLPLDGLASNTSSNCAPPPAGLFSWWPGETDATDVVGPGAGVLTGDASIEPGFVGGALSFHGPGGYVAIPNAAAFDFAPSERFTVETWVCPNVVWLAPTGYQALIVKSPASGLWDWGLYLTPDGTFMAGRHVGYAVFSSTIAQPHVWHHVAVVYDAGNWALFVDGVLESEASGAPITQSDGALSLGRKGSTLDWQGFVDFYDGLLDDVAIYRRALSSGEIAAIFEAGSAGKCLLPVPASATTWGRVKLHGR